MKAIVPGTMAELWQSHNSNGVSRRQNRGCASVLKPFRKERQTARQGALFWQNRQILIRANGKSVKLFPVCQSPRQGAMIRHRRWLISIAFEISKQPHNHSIIHVVAISRTSDPSGREKETGGVIA